MALVRRQREPTVIGPLEALLAAARAHGEASDPDMEVGDLEQMLYAAWDLMNVKQRRELYRQFRELVESWGEL